VKFILIHFFLVRICVSDKIVLLEEHFFKLLSFDKLVCTWFNTRWLYGNCLVHGSGMTF
jgi:hypothetical protein